MESQKSNDNPRKRRRNIVLEKLAFFGEKSTVHGIPFYVRADRLPVKVMWGLIILVSSCYCAYVVLASVMVYLQFEVDTNIEILRDSDAKFPTVSICIVQVCDLDSQGTQYRSLMSRMVQEEFNSTGNLTQSQLDEIMKNYDLKSFIKKSREYFVKNYNNKDELKKYSSDSKTSIRWNIISCQYSSEYCFENDFEFFKINEFQKCYRFNSGKTFMGDNVEIRSARRYGKNYGLQLEMFVGLPDECQSAFSSTYGVHLYVHNNSVTITDESNGILLSPGRQTNIAIDRTFVSKMPSPYSDCIPNGDASKSGASKMVEKTFKYTNSYTQTTCMQLCYQDYLQKKYQCYNPYLPYLNDTNYSTCPKMSESLNNSIYYDQQSYYAEKGYEKCFEQCPVECLYTTYETTVSSSQFPTVTYSEVLSYNENVSEKFESYRGEKQFNMIESSVLAVNVFYKTDLYTRITEKPSIEWDKFISNLGGSVGLFLGMGFLSLVELIEIAYEIIMVFFENKKDDEKKIKQSVSKKISVQPVELEITKE